MRQFSNIDLTDLYKIVNSHKLRIPNYGIIFNSLEDQFILILTEMKQNKSTNWKHYFLALIKNKTDINAFRTAVLKIIPEQIELLDKLLILK